VLHHLGCLAQDEYYIYIYIYIYTSSGLAPRTPFARVSQNLVQWPHVARDSGTQDPPNNKRLRPLGLGPYSDGDASVGGHLWRF